jgi:hypothetical protein
VPSSRDEPPGKERLIRGQPVIREYDLEEDSVWSLALGCTGAVNICIERLEDDPVTPS